MLTLIEGPDGTGKTTLCHSPAFQDLNYVKWGPPDFPDENMFLKFFEGLLRTPDNSLLDRLYPSEMIYGPLFNRKVWVDRIRQRMFDRYLLSRQTVMLICMAKFETALNNWAERRLAGGEYVVHEEWYRRVYQGYRTFQCDIPKIYHDYTTGSTAYQVRQRIEMRRPPRNEGPGIGMFKPGVTLMVGEQINPNCQGPGLPFIQFEQGGSWWLTNQLEDAGIPEHQLYWVNARDFLTGTWLDPRFLDLLEPTHAVALGQEAARWCHDKAGMAYSEIPHPSYWRRFKSGEPYPIGEAVGTPTTVPDRST